MNSDRTFYAGVEGGGTKFVCMVASGPDDIRARVKIPTRSPGDTLKEVIQFFRAHGPFAGVGIATFGPCDLDPESPTYGHLTTTPKAGWENFDMLGAFRRAFEVPLGFDTDVNAAALGEWRWGAGQGLNTILYLTVGTGIGGGGIIRGQRMHGLVHPEMGHIRLPRDLKIDNFPGVCPFHGDCLQGLASGPAMEARWARRAEELPREHPAWQVEARYLALALNDFICVLSPQRIILGGGVMAQEHLFPLIRVEVKRLLNGYIQSPMFLERIDEYIVPPLLAEGAGVFGAIALAMEAAEDQPGRR
jgi:fructokinase